MPSTSLPILNPILNQSPGPTLLSNPPTFSSFTHDPPSPPIPSPILSSAPHSASSSSILAAPSIQIPPLNPSASASIHPMITHARNNISKPKNPTDGTVRYPLPRALLAKASPSEVEPTCYSAAIKDANWRSAMNLEFDALLKNQIWTLVPSTSAENIIGCKWVFRLRRKADGTIDRYKARLVAKGFHQQPGIDYGETYSPVIKPTTVCIVLSIALSSGWPIHQIDIQNAFLHGNLSEEVYMSQPPGFAHPQYPTHLWKLQKALYGLKQAPMALFSKLSCKLINLGFHSSKSDTSLFIYQSATYHMFVLIYIDDILIICSKPAVIHELLLYIMNSL